jgi:hypothetical protein
MEPKIPDEFEMIVSGWMRKDDAISPTSFMGSPRLEVNGQYIGLS